MFPSDLIQDANRLIGELRAVGTTLATAESCTGGLIAALLTEIPGASDVLDRSFVTYSNAAKADMLGVDLKLIVRHGAVSEEVARAMAVGALENSAANIALAVTGIAGPGGGSASKPVGLVHICAATSNGIINHEAHHYGDIGRSAVRLATVRDSLRLLGSLNATRSPPT